MRVVISPQYLFYGTPKLSVIFFYNYNGNSILKENISKEYHYNFRYSVEF